MNIQTLKNINKALIESGEDVKLKLKNVLELKSKNLLIHDMWCGLSMQMFYINTTTKEIKKAFFIEIEGKTKLVSCKDFKPIKY